jgi:hypothetical protein
MYITQALQNGIWKGNCTAAGRFCGTVAFGWGKDRGKFEITPGFFDGFTN